MTYGYNFQIIYKVMFSGRFLEKDEHHQELSFKILTLTMDYSERYSRETIYEAIILVPILFNDNLEGILDSILDENSDICERLEGIIFKIVKKPIKVVQDTKVNCDIKSKYFSLILSDHNLTEEQRKAISLILNQADLIMRNRNLSDEIEERKWVDRAKGILMRRGMSEEEAYNYMRKKAMDGGKTIKDIAQSIVLLKEVGL